jgi:hypothetical protein
MVLMVKTEKMVRMAPMARTVKMEKMGELRHLKLRVGNGLSLWIMGKHTIV